MAENQEKTKTFEENFPEVQADKKYGQLSQDIINYLIELEYTHFREYKPVPFCGLLVYPATVREFEAFSNATGCLTLNKNESIQGIRTSNLGYLFLKMQDPKEGRMWSYRFSNLCEIIFHIKNNGLKCKKCGEVLEFQSPEFQQFIQDAQKYAEYINKKINSSKVQTAETINEDIENEEEIPQPPSLKCPKCGGTDDFVEIIKITQDPTTKEYKLIIDGHEISSQDFNKLRQLVLYQNFADYVDDSWVDPSLKKDHDEKMRLEQQRNDVHATIEKKVICLSVTTSYKVNEIYDMPIREFTLLLSTVDDLINYKIMRQAVSSGFVSLKKGEKIEHWIYKPDKDMYGDSYKSVDQIKNEVSNL